MEARWMSVAVLLAFVAGCDGGDAIVIDARVVDAAVDDARVVDAGADAPVTDASAIDAAAIDAAATDAAAIDAAAIDAAAIDDAAIDAPEIDAQAPVDAQAVDAQAVDAQPADASASGYQCAPMNLTPAQVCAVALTGQITACSISGGIPSQNASLEVRRPDGARGYLCANVWTSSGGFFFSSRRTLKTSASSCCGGPASPPVGWPATDEYFGVPHGPTHVKTQEMVATTGGDFRPNPFSVVVSSPASAAAFNQARANWASWSGDGQPHPGPDSSGAYYFPAFLVVNYVVVPTADGRPLILIAPEPSLDAANNRPLGHPTIGACAGGSGGTPFAFIGGDIRNTTLTNGSGRYGAESTITAADLDNAARLFNCYGIPITDVIYTAP